MSRTIIGGIVAILIAAVTVLVYILVTTSLPAIGRREARELAARVPDQAVRNASLESLDLSKRVEQFAAQDAALRQALTSPDAGFRRQQIELAFGRFRDAQTRGARSNVPPPTMVLVNGAGDVVARPEVNNPVAGEYKQDGKIAWPALDVATRQRVVMSEVRADGQGLYRYGIASVVDVPGADGTPGKILGAVIVGEPLDNDAAVRQGATLGTRVAYVDRDQVFATSFGQGKGAGAQSALVAAVPAASKGLTRVTIGGTRYLATAVPLPRLSSIELPAGYPAQTASLLVLVSESRAMPEQGKAGRLILLLGGLALVLALAGIYLSSKRILDQVDQLEVGVAEIINGNTERTFRPVGAELDGLANGLNVMLARLTGRPEPSDDDYDEDGAAPTAVEFGEASRAHSAAETELAALAREPEAAYYQRLYGEYRAAREAAGNPDAVTLEGFTAKLRVNEGKLKAAHQCRMVRFKVAVADGKVTLKPVPIV